NQPAADRLAFLRMQIFHFLVGNADAHGKNFALLHPLKPAAPSLAPLYDVVCTAAYPALTKRIAMSVGGRNLPDTIGLNHWLTLVPTARACENTADANE
ncbi:MAG: HipA domain-containing protein, partial [Granulosicoccus sp.]